LLIVFRYGKEKRDYKNKSSVQQQYDHWTKDGVLEHYWGDHIHHGFYADGEYQGHNFKLAKVEMIEQIIKWAEISKPQNILDIGCGIGGSARFLAKKFGAKVTGVTLSEQQKRRADQLNAQHGLQNLVTIEVGDALNLRFEDATFDLVWSLESAEHMPDKKNLFQKSPVW